MRRLEKLLLAGLVAAALLPYLNALGNGFTFDDHGQVVDNPLVQRADTAFTAFFTQPFYPGALYRPISFYSFWLNRRLSGPAAFGFHAVNVGLHALVTLLLFFLLRSLRLGLAVSAVAAAVFAVHPIHTEAVSSIVGRAELLSAAAVLGALYCAARARAATAMENGGGSAPRRARAAWLAAAAALFALGLLCKESAFVLLPLLVVTTWIGEARSLGGVIRSLCRSAEMPVLATIGAAYLGLRWALFGTLAVGDDITWLDNPLAHTPALVRLRTAVLVVVDSMAQLVVPVHLSADYSFDQIPLIESWLDPRLLAALTALLLLAALCWRSRGGGRGVAGGPWFFIAASALTANLIFPIGTIRGERLLYLPSAGFSLIAGIAAASALRRRRPWAVAAVGVVLSLLALRTWARNLDWASDLSLFTATVETCPYSAKAQHNYASALSDAGRYEEAVLAFRRALQLHPYYEESAFGLGRTYELRGMTEGALHWYDEALRIEPAHVKSRLNRGVIFYNRGDIEGAEREFRTGLDAHPGEPRLLTGIGFVLLARGSLGEARTVLEQARQRAPDDPQTLRALHIVEEQAARRSAEQTKGS